MEEGAPPPAPARKSAEEGKPGEVEVGVSEEKPEEEEDVAPPPPEADGDKSKKIGSVRTVCRIVAG